MKRGKRSLSLLLACIMALAVLPETAQATGTERESAQGKTSVVTAAKESLQEVAYYGDYQDCTMPHDMAQAYIDVLDNLSPASQWSVILADPAGDGMPLLIASEMYGGTYVGTYLWTWDGKRALSFNWLEDTPNFHPDLGSGEAGFPYLGTWNGKAAVSFDWTFGQDFACPSANNIYYVSNGQLTLAQKLVTYRAHQAPKLNGSDLDTAYIYYENAPLVESKKNPEGTGYIASASAMQEAGWLYYDLGLGSGLLILPELNNEYQFFDSYSAYEAWSQQLADTFTSDDDWVSKTEHGWSTVSAMKSALVAYAKETLEFQLGRDNFSFVNEPSAFLTSEECTTWADPDQVIRIKLSEDAFQKIVAQATTPKEVAACLWACSSEWTGSCFGMSSVMSILYRERDRLPADLGDTASAVPAPSHSTLAQDVINSYQVGWQLAAVQNLALKEQQKAEVNYAGALQDLIDSVNDTSTPTVIAMQDGETAHAVLLLSVLEENEEYYVIACCDPNNAEEFTEMLVYKAPGNDQLGLRISYEGSTLAGEPRTVYDSLYYWSTSLEDIDAYQYFTENNYQESYAAALLTLYKTQGVLVRNETGKRYIVDGKSLLEGIVFGPILDPAQLSVTDNAGAQPVRYYLDDSTATGYTVGFDQMEAGGSVQLLADDLGVCLSTTGGGSLTVEEGTKTVTVHLDAQADTTVAITNQEADADWDWFQAEITVPDVASLRLTLTEDGVAVQGNNLEQAEVTVYGWEGTQTVGTETQEGQLIIDKEVPLTENVFVDIAPTDYYYAPVLWAVDKGITNGTGSDTFSPGAPCTRAQMAAFLWRAAGSPTPTVTTCGFTDLDQNAYYYEAVLWAVEQGITEGTGPATYSPNNPCTRGQMATFLYRYSNTPAVTGTSPFEDVARDVYYHDAVCWAVAQKITNGISATQFSPEGPCTRGQMVTFLYRLLEE